MPQRIGGKIAKLLGAGYGEVIAADTTSINIFKVVSAALDMRQERLVIVSGMTHAPEALSAEVKIPYLAVH